MKKSLRNLWSLCTVSLLIVAFSVAQNGQKPIVTSDLLKLVTLSQPQISPDGKTVVFLATRMGKDGKGKYRYFRTLWIADLAGERGLHQLTFGERTDSAPRWSPDGRRIAFVRPRKGKPQIWILPLQGGEAYALTNAEYGASRPRWSPDGESLLYSSSLPMNTIAGTPTWKDERPGRSWGDAPNWKQIEEQKEKKEEKEGQEAAQPDGNVEQIRAWLARNASRENPKVLTRLDLLGEHHLEPQLSFRHIFLIKVQAGAEAVELTHGFQDYATPEWSPNGKSIVCVSVLYREHPDRVRDSNLWMIDPEDGSSRVVLDWPGQLISRPSFSPNGKKILFLTQDRNDPSYAQRKVALVSSKGGTPQSLTRDFDRSAFSPRWAPDGESVYFVAANQGSFPLFQVSAKGGAVETVIGGPRGVRDFALRGDRLVYALTEVADPFELYVSRLDGKQARSLTSFNRDWIRERRVVIPRQHLLARPDGTQVQYWTMEPAGRKPGEKYPLVLEIHGGPSAMWGPGEFTMWHEFQLLASWGYGVVFCNPRGSGGYGHAFQKANFQDWGSGPAGDILAVADHVSQLDWVDSKQQFVTGGSYAGYMTAWIVGHDDRFKAAVAQRGVYDLSTFFGEGNAWRLVPYHFGGYPWQPEVRKILNENSPLSYVADIHTPLLIIHSDQDLRTGTSESEMLYRSLKVLKRPVEYVRYPQEGHDLSRSGNPGRRLDRLDRIVEFFERYVKHPEPPPAAGQDW